MFRRSQRTLKMKEWFFFNLNFLQHKHLLLVKVHEFKNIEVANQQFYLHFSAFVFEKKKQTTKLLCTIYIVL